MSYRCAGHVVLGCLVVLVFALPVCAQEKLSENRLDPRFADTPMITDPFDFSLGGFLVDLNTSAAVGSGVGIGSIIQLEEIFGLDEDQSLLRLGFRWDFARKHSIGLTWFAISRTSSGVFGQTVDFADLRFCADFDGRIQSRPRSRAAPVFRTRWLGWLRLHRQRQRPRPSEPHVRLRPPVRLRHPGQSR